MATTEPVRNSDDVRAMMDYEWERFKPRNNCFIGFGVYSALRVSDLIRMRWGDVYDFNLGRFKERLFITEQKTKKNKSVFLNDHLIQILEAYKMDLEESGDELAPDIFLFRSQKGDNRSITRHHAYRITKAAAQGVGVTGVIGCHSLRKTFGYAAHKNGFPPTVIMDIYNHSSYKLTKIYLGIGQDERDEVYRDISFR